MVEREAKIYTSMMVNEQPRLKSASLSGALCTLPKMLAVPTPRAVPENRLSTSCLILHQTSELDVNTEDENTHPQASAHLGLTKAISAADNDDGEEEYRLIVD